VVAQHAAACSAAGARARFLISEGGIRQHGPHASGSTAAVAIGRCRLPGKAGASRLATRTPAARRGCRTNPQRGRQIVSKGGYRNRPSHPLREVRRSRRRDAYWLWRPSPRLSSSIFETALCNSLRPTRQRTSTRRRRLFHAGAAATARRSLQIGITRIIKTNGAGMPIELRGLTLVAGHFDGPSALGLGRREVRHAERLPAAWRPKVRVDRRASVQRVPIRPATRRYARSLPVAAARGGRRIQRLRLARQERRW
jgi:hypothetical protein